MNKEHKTVVKYAFGITAVVMLVAANLVWGISQKQQRAADAQQAQLEQSQKNAVAAARVEAKRVKEQEERIANIPPIVARPTPAPTPTPEPPRENHPQGDGSVVTDQPEYQRPTPPPVPTPTPEQPANPEQPVTPTEPTPKPQASKPKDGDRRTNADGMLEIYIGGFGWVEYAPGGTYEEIEMNPNGNIVGY